MIELARHIEILLLDNDCVIVPGLGGFVSHPVAARRIDEEGLFMPPCRTLGFNPMMKLNDGLLVQSYMAAYDVTYPEAVKLVEARVTTLKELLQEKGEVELNGIGILRMNIEGQYTFCPMESGILSPAFYGLSSFEFPTLQELAARNAAQPRQSVAQSIPVEKKEKKQTQPIVIHLNRSWLNNSIAAAVAVILFFVLSVPVENQYVTKQGMAYADIQHTFEQIRHQSMVSSLWNESQPMLVSEARPVNPKSVSAPAQVPDQPKQSETETEHKAQAETPQPAVEPTQPEKYYTIVLASQVSVGNAERFVEKLKTRGMTEAEVLTRAKITRVIYSRFATEQEAYRKLNHLKEDPEFAQAWILQVK